MLKIKDLYNLALTESEDKDWNDNVVADISETDNDLLKDELVTLVDAEFEQIQDYSKEEFFNFASNTFKDISKTLTDEVWDMYLG